MDPDKVRLPGLEDDPRGNWILTATGGRFYFGDPKPEDFNIEDIATALSRINRFGGHTTKFYSVAQHVVLGTRWLVKTMGASFDLSITGDSADARTFLLHDAAEAYMGDMVRPLKALMPAFTEVELRLEASLAKRFDTRFPFPPWVKRLDNELLVTEARDVRVDAGLWTNTTGIAALPFKINPWGPEKAKREFLKEWEKWKPDA